MKLVRARAGDGSKYGAGEKSVLGAVTVGDQLEFLEGVGRGQVQPGVVVGAGVVDAVHLPVHLVLMRAVDVEIVRGTVAAVERRLDDRACNPGQQRRQLQGIASVKRQSFDSFLLNHISDSGVCRLQLFGPTRNSHGLGNLANFHGRVDG